MRVLLLTHYFPPEVGAPQTRLAETATVLSELGHDVRVLTGPPHYPDGQVRHGYGSARVQHERRKGVPIVRLPMIARPNRGFIDRVIDHGSFAAVATGALKEVRWAEVLLVESPPLFLGLTAAFHRIATRRPYLFHVADPWPDFPIEMGVLRNRYAQRVAFGIEGMAYRYASLITTVTPGLVALLDAKPTATGRVRLLPNGVDVNRFNDAVTVEAAQAHLGWPRAALTLAYVGSVGLAQGVETLITAVAPLADEGVVLRIVGDGHDRNKLLRETAERSLTHVQFDGAVSASAVPDVLAAADATVVMLRRGRLYEESLPTKLVEGLAAARPVVVSAGGLAARVIS